MTIDLHELKQRRGIDLTVWPPVYEPRWMPASGDRYWLPEIETAAPEDRDELIFEKLRRQIGYAWEHSEFYRDKWARAGLTPRSLASLEDLERFPVVTKQDLRASQEKSPPFGDYLCIDPLDVHRIHGTSGTTGRPTVFGIGDDDWARIGAAHSRVMWGAGLRPDDVIMICSFFSLYIGSWGALAGGERLGATVFPFGAGVQGQTVQAVKWARDATPTAFYGTPSYALHFAEVARREGVDPSSLGFRTLIFSGEPGAGIPATKASIEETFDGICIDMGTMAEMTPWMTNAECTERTGMHMYQDIVYTQVCDPETYESLPPGSEGTPVYTHLERTSQPMIRLVSGDRTRWVTDACPCGRTYPRLPDGLYGRFDDMMTIRGVNVYPSIIEDVLRGTAGFGGEFRIIVSRDGAIDDLVVRVEHQNAQADAEVIEVSQREVRDRLKERIGVTPVVELVSCESLERTGFKARRVIDDRDLYESIRGGRG